MAKVYDVKKAQAHGMVKTKNLPVLEAGHKLSVRPGVLIQKVTRQDSLGRNIKRYQVTED